MELSVIKVQLAEIESEKNRVVDEKQYIDIAREILNDTGVKANIIKKYLPIMNQLINENLQAMDFFVNFHLNEEFEETIKSRNRDTFNYLLTFFEFLFIHQLIFIIKKFAHYYLPCNKSNSPFSNLHPDHMIPKQEPL